ALPAPRPYGDYGRVVNFRTDESYADAVGAFVAHLVAGGRAPRDVCVLLKRFSAGGPRWASPSGGRGGAERPRSAAATRPYVRALEARRIPHVLVGGRSFHAREEVAALRNAAAAIEWPDDRLAVFATLRGAFFGFSDDDLLAGGESVAAAR